MTDNTTPQPDWDKELEDLVDQVANDDQATATDEATLAADAAVQAAVAGAASAAGSADLAELLAERTADLQRLQAEYVNYKRRVDRDRDVARQRGIEAVVADLLPVLDGIDAARAHGDLTAGAAMLADELSKVGAKYGLESFGAVGDPFDPHIHEALMHIDAPGYSVASVAQVFQRGYQLGGRVIRPARVGVAEADESIAASEQAGGDAGSPEAATPVNPTSGKDVTPQEETDKTASDAGADQA